MYVRVIVIYLSISNKNEREIESAYPAVGSLLRLDIISAAVRVAGHFNLPMLSKIWKIKIPEAPTYGSSLAVYSSLL